MLFMNNTATESGGGIYVEFPPIRFVIDIFNRLCFLQYSNGSGTDIPPQDWEVLHILGKVGGAAKQVGGVARESGRGLRSTARERGVPLGRMGEVVLERGGGVAREAGRCG